MSTRVLGWNGLVQVAERKNPADRVIAIAGVPARVVPHLATDAGFYVRTIDEDHRDDYWALRSAEEIRLLRQLVDAGQVTIDDGVDPWRLIEWQMRLDAYERCFVAGCGDGTIDPRGPVFDIAGRMHLACPPHWTAVMGVLGEQTARNPDAEEAAADGDGHPH